MNVGVTGYSGFIGWHLRARLRLEEDIHTIPLGREAFTDAGVLTALLKECDAVVHLAGGRFSADDAEDYEANMALTDALIRGLNSAGKPLPVFFASSRSREKESGYGRSKRDGEAKLVTWGQERHAPVFSLIMPNVFGEFAQPDHHIVLATFCRDIAEGRDSVINKAGTVELIHAQDVAEEVLSFLRNPTLGEKRMEGEMFNVPEVYELLSNFHASYLRGEFPALASRTEKRLFNMYYAVAFRRLVPRPLQPKTDERGTLVETLRALSPGQSFFSTSVPGVTRGEHYHMRKIERFAVVKGEARIRLRKLFSEEVLEFSVSGDRPTYIDMPTFYTHHIENTGKGELLTYFWTNELYDQEDSDTYPEPVLV